MMPSQPSRQRHHVRNEVEPYELDPGKKNPFLSIDDSKLVITYKPPGPRLHSSDTTVGSIQANCAIPLHRHVYYYELKVLNAGQSGAIAIGFAPGNFKLGRQPGWEAGSFGYHGDDGKKFGGSSTGRGNNYGPLFSYGDIVGAAIDLNKCQIFFTKNGEKLKTAFENVQAAGMFPTVGLHSPEEKIEVNFGRRPFAFDIERWCDDQNAAQDAVISKHHVGSEVLHGLVRSYLRHYGYADSLAAFDAVAHQLPTHVTQNQQQDTPLESQELQLRHALRKAINSGDVEAARKLLMTSRFASLLDTSDLQSMSLEAPPPAPENPPPDESSVAVRGNSAGDCPTGLNCPTDLTGNGTFHSAAADRQSGLWAFDPATFMQGGTESEPSSDGSEDDGDPRDGSPPGSASGSPPSEWDAQEDDSESEPAGPEDMEVELRVGADRAASRIADNDVALHLACQQLVELVREKRIEEAVTFAQKELAPLMKASPKHAEIVATAFGLIAYPCPADSPLSSLLTHQKREATADIVNAAVLRAVAAEATSAKETPKKKQATVAVPLGRLRVGPAPRNRNPTISMMRTIGLLNGDAAGGIQTPVTARESQGATRPSGDLSSSVHRQQQPPQSPLHTVIAHLATVQHHIYEANGNQGDPFSIESLLSRAAMPTAKPKTA